MTTPTAAASDKAWAMIDREKRLDRIIKGVSIAAWSATFLIVVLVAVMVGVQVAEMVKGYREGGIPWMTVVWSAMPLISVLWVLSLLVASLSTIAVFLRLRTASLAEIQLRLAALEDMLASQPDSRQK